MNLRFASRMVRRDGRASGRRLALHMLSITIGVAALVAINSFRADVERSVKAQAKTLLGSDLELATNRPFPDSVRAVLDSAAATGVPVSYATGFASMALAPASGQTRLVQVQAMEGTHPYYGVVQTEPAGIWGTFRNGPQVLVDETLLIQLDLTIGDSLKLGDKAFEVVGTVTNYPGRLSLQTAIGARVYLAQQYLPETNLIRRGSRAFYEANLRIPDPNVVRRFVSWNQDLFERHQVRWETVDETEDDLTDALDTLARFLGLVGLSALLLGGVGVASAVHVFVKSRLQTAAVLRCLGARQSTVFAIYLAQATLMGLAGAASGVVLGVAVQFLLPRVLGDFLPLDIVVRVHPPALLTGLGIGVLVAVLFAVIPLLVILDVPPLRALRRDFESGAQRKSLLWFAALAALLGSVLWLSLWQAPLPQIGFAFAGAAAVTAFALWTTAALLMRGTRRFFPRRARYVVRQGIANLFRPRNQTVAVTMALGFGLFLIAVLYVVQRNITDRFVVGSGAARPNLVMFDIQPDQREGVQALVDRYGMAALQATPIVPARIAALEGRTVEDILDSADLDYERWALRRQYRHTYRDTLVGSEQLVAGVWWTDAPATDVARISVEVDIAEDLQLEVGDRVTWNVQGVEIETEVASLRRVDWARFEPNFFVVFEPGVLEDAPQMLVTLSRADDPAVRARFQRDLVRGFPNVAALDLTMVQRTVDRIVGRVTLAVRFMAFFSIASGIIILIGALATSRFQRMRESVLLKTLGATARQVRAVLITEYFALGALGGMSGILLAAVGGWAAIRFMFELPFELPVLPLLAFWLGTALLTTGIGVLAGRDVIRRPPLEIMRAISE